MAFVAELIRARREAAGLSRAELARIVQVDWRTLWRWETGRRHPRADILERLLKATETPAKSTQDANSTAAKARRLK